MVIFSPARAACQQGKAQTNVWKIHPGEQQKWENPLMGWTSTGDPMAHQLNSVLNFGSKEAAVAFCEKHGWDYEIALPQQMVRRRRRAPIPFRLSRRLRVKPLKRSKSRPPRLTQSTRSTDVPFITGPRREHHPWRGQGVHATQVFRR